MDPQVDVIVVSYNTKDLLLECLMSVFESIAGREARVVVVDNASEDGSPEAARLHYPQATIVSNSANIGFGAACNQAIRATGSPFVLLLNSDARLTETGFKTLFDCLDLNPRCGAAGCRLVNAQGLETTNARNFLTPFNQTLELAGLKLRSARRTLYPISNEETDFSVDWIDGACLMLRRSALEEIGLFDEQFFMYSEDEDLCFRLKEKGWLVCFCRSGTAIHHGGASSNLDERAALRQFYKSQILFLLKHRGPLSEFLYSAGMRLVLILKSLLLNDGLRRDLARRHLEALKESRQMIKRGRQL